MIAPADNGRDDAAREPAAFILYLALNYFRAQCRLRRYIETKLAQTLQDLRTLMTRQDGYNGRPVRSGDAEHLEIEATMLPGWAEYLVVMDRQTADRVVLPMHVPTESMYFDGSDLSHYLAARDEAAHRAWRDFLNGPDITAALRELERLGLVRHILAENEEHHAYRLYSGLCELVMVDSQEASCPVVPGVSRCRQQPPSRN